MKTMTLAGLGLCFVSIMTQVSRADWDDRRHNDRDRDRDRGRSAGFFGTGLILGGIISSLPREHTTVVVANRPYYYSNRVYYRTCPDGYVIVNPPMVVTQPQVVMVQAPAASDFYRLGHDWARDLRDDVVTREQFIRYVRSDVLHATRSDFSEFRRGFATAYGVNGDSAFDKALQTARHD